MPNVRLRILSYVVIAYMLLAFTWWSVLLWKTLDDAFRAKSDSLELRMAADGLIRTPYDFYRSPEYRELEDRYQRQQWMVAGEGLFFVISLVVGIWLINRAYYKEVHSARQRRNFLLSITHELKSPIASIRLVLETLQKRRQLAPEQSEKLLHNGLRETERLNTLVNDLLLSAKLETSYQPQIDRMDLDELLCDIVQKMRDRYPGGTFAYECDPVSLTVEGDKMGLTSMVLNLLENAVKYSADPAHVSLRATQQGDQVLIEVADQGIGIEEGEKERIFEKFYRVGSEDTRTTKGTGLGLFIVSEIVKAHHGKITVADNTPKGTTFRITLPIEQAEAETPPNK